MSLKLASSTAGEVRIHIVAIPAIGCRPESTWRYPGSVDPMLADPKDAPKRTDTIFSDVPNAQVYLYSHPRNLGSGVVTIDSYARDLLTQLQSIPDIGKCSLHFAAHGTGGIVLKAALLLARISNLESHKKIVSSRIGIGFFGVPHSGSIYFSESDYKIQDDETRSIVESAGSHWRNHILMENSPDLEELNQKFALFAMRLPKIWSFVETMPTAIWRLRSKRAKTHTVVNDLIVPTWSATVTTANMPINCEQVISIHSSHADLCRFGNDAATKVFADYIGDLHSITSSFGLQTHVDHDRVEDHVFVDLHVFYSADPGTAVLPIKIISDRASLGHLIKEGPDACLEEQVHSHVGEFREGGRRKTSRAKPVPALVFTSPEGEEIDVEDDARSISMESMASESASDSRSMSQERMPLMQAPSFNEDGVVEKFPSKKSSRKLQSVLPGYRFRWIHVPATNMSWVPALLNTIGEEAGEARLSTSLLDEEIWSSQQYEALHGFPHGRFMRPGCGAFFPNNHWMHRSSSSFTNNLASPVDDVQMFAYLPYLNWDTYGNLLSRNALVKDRIRAGSLAKHREDIFKGKSIENILIWQYLYDSSNFPYHLRRSLDQFGYPTLADTSARDGDQILYKWWIRKRQKEEQKMGGKRKEQKANPGQLYEMMKADIARRRGHRTAFPRRTELVEEPVENDAKVLMVDQLWIWILNSDTLVTFFPFREDEKMEAFTSQADLRSAVLDKIKGHPRYSHQCTNPFDLAALIVLHAITEFVDRPRDKELEVLRVFDEHINTLIERQNMSFRQFRKAHQQITQLGMMSSKPLDNSDDLGALLELRDIEDELNMLSKLFNDQEGVLDKLILLCDDIPVLNSGTQKSQGLAFLQKAKQRLKEYESQIAEMKKSCHATQESYKALLDMKQKQANADEAWFARKSAQVAANQSRSVMIFTIFTIIFLPLSFFTSLFGMNIREWSGVTSNMPMHTVLVLMMSISTAVILIALLLAFNKPIRVTVQWFFAEGYRKIPVSVSSWALRRRGSARHLDLDKEDDEWQPMSWQEKAKRQ